MPRGSGAAEARLIAQRLARVPNELRSTMRPALRRAAQPIADQAKANASWSTRIPRSIRIVPSFAARNPSVTIKASARIAPHARAYEGASSGGSTFRHPVFGNREVWVSQAKRPFLFPAVRAGQRAVTGEIEHAIDDTLRRAGF